MANKPTLDEMRLALSKVTRPPQQTNLDMAREEAERIGQHHDPHTRSLQQGYEHDWYHGGTGNVKAFDPKTLGESTGAASAKKGFFFARDPSTPPPEMLEHDPESVEFLKKLGKPIPPKKTMEGHGSATASSYAGTGGSREYKEAMRMAKAAERVGNWSEYEKYMQIAEDSEINNMRYRQDLVAKHGDARDQMYEDIKNAWYGPHNAEMFKGMSQPDYEAHDKRYKELMPYGWHIHYQKPHYDVLKKELQKFGKHKQIESALKSINHYQSVHNERKASELESGANVMPVALRYKNPMYHDFKGNSYRDQTYSDLMDEAKRKGHDALILKNTFDPGGSGTPKMVDVGVMFHPNQVRSKFAAFDPTRTHESDLLAAKGGSVPSEPGSTPIKEGHVRLYHQTDGDNLREIEKHGLLLKHAKGIEGPRAIYAGETPFYGDATKKPTLEFQVPKEHWDAPFVLRDVHPQDFISAHYPWHRHARYLEDESGIKNVLSGKFDTLKGDEGKAVEYIKNKYSTKKANGGKVTHAHHLEIEERPI